jgi:hypothetical protein
MRPFEMQNLNKALSLEATHLHRFLLYTEVAIDIFSASEVLSICLGGICFEYE